MSGSQAIPQALVEVIELEIRILVIVICLLLVICDLEFFTETQKFPLRSNWRRQPEAGLNLEPGTLCAFNCIAQGSRDTSKMTRH
jgi:hypothetical protein